MPSSKVEPSTGTAVDLDRTYARRFSGQEPRRAKVWRVLNQRCFQKWVRPTDAVLDLGAGYCEFINSIQARQKFALDLNPATLKHAAPDVSVLSQDVSRPWELASASVDVVFTSNFLEHLETKQILQSCLREAARVLRPGGQFVALGPNIRFCSNVYWDFFDHHIALSDRSLVEALELNGFRAEVVIPRFLPYTMRQALPSHPALVRLYLQMPWIWPVFGKQFLIVAST